MQIKLNQDMLLALEKKTTKKVKEIAQLKIALSHEYTSRSKARLHTIRLDLIREVKVNAKTR